MVSAEIGILFAAALGGIGLACLVYRKTFIGTLIGAQILGMGASLVFIQSVFSSLSTPTAQTGAVGGAGTGYLFALFIALSGVSQLVTGLALSVRLFYLRKHASMSDLKNLKS